MQLGIQGAPGDAQLLGRLAHIAPVGLQDIQQDLHFTGLQGPSPARVPAGKDRGRDIAGSGRGLPPVPAAQVLVFPLQKGKRQVFPLYGIPAGDVEGTLHDVLQFPHVPRPGITAEDLGDFCREPPAWLVDGLYAGPEERFRQQHDVLLPFPQGRDIDGQHAQAVEQILPERAVAHALLQALVGRGDDADVDRPGELAADTAHFLVLDDAQQVDLGLQRHVADLVQEDGPPFRQFELARLALLLRAGERPGVIAEQLALDEVSGQGAAIDDHKRRILAGAGIVDGMGEQFLAGAALPEDEGRDVAVRGDLAESVFGNFSFYSYKKACGQKKTVRGSKNSRRLSNGTPAI